MKVLTFGGGMFLLMTITLHAQNVGIGESTPNAKLHIDVPTTYTQDLFRVSIGGSTKFVIKNNGFVGVLRFTPAVPLHVDNGTSATPSGGGYLQIGNNGQNIVIDDNEILSRSTTSGTPSSLHLNKHGGNVYIHFNLARKQIAFLDNGNTGIGTPVPIRTLHVAGNMRLTNLITGIPIDSILYVDPNGDIGGIDPSALARLTEDKDWLRAGTLHAPRSVNDSIYTLGEVGIGVATPQYSLHIYSNGSNSDGVLFAEGVLGSGDTMPLSPEVSFIWNPNYATLRAGGDFSGAWSTANTGQYSIAFGLDNVASGNYAVVTGGSTNSARGIHSFIGNGYGNSVNSDYSGIGGGFENTILSGTEQAFIGWGIHDTITSGFAPAIVGGEKNYVSGDHAFIGGGYKNRSLNTTAVVVGGDSNIVHSYASFIGGGVHNSVNSSFGVVIGGRLNNIQGTDPNRYAYNTIGGGWSNYIYNSQYATISGGIFDTIINSRAVICGSAQGYISGSNYAFIGGGRANRIVNSGGAGILAGTQNTINAGGGSVILGGNDNVANAPYNLIFGSQVVPTVSEQFRVYLFSPTSSGFLVLNRLDGDFPIHVGTNATNGNGAYLSAGGVWTNASSREFKYSLRLLNPDSILAKVKQLPIYHWAYNNTTEYHISPLAEDFHSLFNVGDVNIPYNNKYLASIDVASVSLLAIQALENKVARLESENAQLKEYIKRLEKRIEALESR
ncbi:MAG: hypothetical protein GXO48_04925 [Chlorobi bacterium]|nr:hypothetical protein [Chlorobiota bacterium]